MSTARTSDGGSSRSGSNGASGASKRTAARSRREGRRVQQAVLVEEMVQALEADIATGVIPVNSWLRQESLASEFDVSRTPVREALRVLQERGMVEVVPNRGALVKGPTSRDLREAYVVRAELEGFAAELAARWIRDDELRRLREAEELFQRSVDAFVNDPESPEGHADPLAHPSDDPDGYPDQASWMQANDLFHRSVQHGAGNARLQRAIEDLHRSFPRNLTWTALSGDSRLLTDNVAEHRRICTAIEERDPEAARELMSEHVTRAGELVVMWFERQAHPT
jgi:DNA-binding GntR family transcriptional regulator